ncbi:MAG: hypothetical protein ACK5XN_06955, partial [Bacteroidota bacterium]
MEQGDHVSCTITINGGTCSGKSVSSNEITMTVNPNVTPTLLLASSTGNTVCFGTNILFTATPNNLGGGTIDSYDFKINGNTVQNTSSNILSVSNLTNGQQINCTVNISGGTCSAANAVSNSIAMQVAEPPVLTLTATPSGTQCSGTSILFTAVAGNLNSGTVSSYNFKINGTSAQNTNSNTFTSTQIQNGDVISCEIVVSGGTCSGRGAVSNSITASIVQNFTPAVVL